MKISVNAGHTPSGKAGCGAVGNLDESKCTREIAPLVAEYLRKEGQKVQLNIENYSNSYNCEDCYNRANKANNWGADLYVEIHLNAGGGTGTEVEISGFGGKAEQYAKKVAEKVANTLGLPNRGVHKMNLIVLNRTNMPAILVECCFVDSNDYKHYNADKIARAIAEGILSKSISNNVSTTNKPAKQANDYLKAHNISIWQVQELLQMAGYHFNKIDGVCGNTTAKYIGDVQKRAGMNVDYCFGKKTLKATTDLINKNFIK